MVFPKNCSGIWSFLYFSERWFFFFPKIWSYPLDGKWKMTFLKKIHGKMIFSSNVLKRWSFQKNCTGTWSFLYYLERLENERWYFSRNTRRYDIFCIYKRDIMPLCQKKKKKKSKMILSHKNTPKGDWHSRLTF